MVRCCPSSPSWELSLFSVRGIGVRLHASFLLFFLVQFVAGLSHAREFPVVLAYAFVVYGPVLFVTVLAHELGHALACRRLGGVVHGVVLWPLGGLALFGPSHHDVAGDLVVAAAGPLAHLPMAAFWAASYGVINGSDFAQFRGGEVFLDTLSSSLLGFWSVVSAQAFYLNLLLLCVNLFVPAYPLDGARCMAATLVMLGSDVRDAGTITSVAAMIASALLGALGIYRLAAKREPSGVLVAVAAAYLFQESRCLYGMVRSGRVRDHPLFARGCYDERERTSDADDGNAADTTTTTTTTTGTDVTSKRAAAAASSAGENRTDDGEFELAGGEAV